MTGEEHVRFAEGDDGTIRATVIAPAKLNLMLAVGPRRPDGFHEVATVMQTIDLVDTIDLDVHMDVAGTERDVLVEADAIPGGDTLVTRALDQLLDVARIGARIWVTIDKEIPIGGGLGGGSSDAATALVAVNTMLGSPCSAAQLAAIAQSLGSDVPFFLLGPGQAAYATGRGEVIRPLNPPTPLPWLLCCPRGVSQSTADVYERFDPATAPALPDSVDEAVRLARRRHVRNDLTIAAREACPDLDRVYTALADAGGVPLVCGSGATVAVRVTSREERRAYEAVCRAASPGCWLRLVRTTRAER